MPPKIDELDDTTGAAAVLVTGAAEVAAVLPEVACEADTVPKRPPPSDELAGTFVVAGLLDAVSRAAPKRLV